MISQEKSHLCENLEKMGIICRDIKKERLIGRCGGCDHIWLTLLRTVKESAEYGAWITYGTQRAK